jgi:hypothetical protein
MDGSDKNVIGPGFVSGNFRVRLSLGRLEAGHHTTTAEEMRLSPSMRGAFCEQYHIFVTRP